MAAQQNAQQNAHPSPEAGGDPFKWITPEARLSYPYLFTPDPKAGSDGKLKYKATLIFPKTVDLAVPRKAIYAAAEKFFGANWQKMLKEKLIKTPFRSGAEKFKLDDNGNKVYTPGYGPETIFISVSCGQKPGLVDQAVQPILDSTMIYPGCYVRASLRAFGYTNSGNKGVSFGLNNIQFLRDGEPLGGLSRANDDFGPVAGAKPAGGGALEDDDLLGGAAASELADDEIQF